MQGVDEYENVITHLYDFAEAQDIEIDTIIQEFGTGQLEVNLLHGDAMAKADEIFLFKRTVREAALRCGAYATFMAKPMRGQPGNAMHIHQSLIDKKSGANLFSDAKGEMRSALLSLYCRSAGLLLRCCLYLGALCELLPPPGARYVGAD